MVQRMLSNITTQFLIINHVISLDRLYPMKRPNISFVSKNINSWRPRTRYASARAEHSKIWQDGADYHFNIADTAFYNRMNVLDLFIGYLLTLSKISYPL